MKRVKILGVAVVLLMAGVTGCGSAHDTKSKENSASKNVVWRPMIPTGFLEEGMQEKEAELQSFINRILKKEKKNYTVKIDFLYEPESEESFYIQDMLKEYREKAEATDVISVLSGISDSEKPECEVKLYQTCAEEQLFLPLDEWLASAEGERIKDVVTDTDLQNARIDGVTYGISAVLPQTMAVAYSKDIMEQCGIGADELSSDIFENEAYLRKVKENTDVIPYKINSADILFDLGYWCDETCYLLGYGADGKFVNLLETPEYQEQMKRLFEWKRQGLLDTVCDKKSGGEGKAFAVPLAELGLENYRTDSYELIVNNGGKEERLYIVPNPKTPFIAPYWGDNKVGIASWTKNQENALDFMTELLANQEIANFLQYGAEGKDYIVNEKQEVQIAEQGHRWTRYFGYQYTNPLITLPTQTMPSDKAAAAERFHEEQEKNLPRGFRIDILPVAEQIRNVNAIYQFREEEEDSEMNALLALTCEDIERAISNIIGELKEAGMDEIVEEANRQLKEWKK